MQFVPEAMGVGRGQSGIYSQDRPPPLVVLPAGWLNVVAPNYFRVVDQRHAWRHSRFPEVRKILLSKPKFTRLEPLIAAATEIDQELYQLDSETRRAPRPAPHAQRTGSISGNEVRYPKSSDPSDSCGDLSSAGRSVRLKI